MQCSPMASLGQTPYEIYPNKKSEVQNMRILDAVTMCCVSRAETVWQECQGGKWHL